MQCMTFEFSRYLEMDLRARKFPHRVLHGPDVALRDSFSRAIVVERDQVAGDTVESIERGVKANPKKHRVRYIGCTVTAYVEATMAGAARHNHEALCDELVDAIIVSADKWAAEAKLLRPEFLESRYLDAEEMRHEVIESWPGVAYILRFRFLRPVLERKYDGTYDAEVSFNEDVSLNPPTLDVSLS